MRILLIAATASVFVSGGAFAQAASTSTATTTASAHHETTMTSASKATVSKECSDQANAKGLHGKERKKFRSSCKAGKA